MWQWFKNTVRRTLSRQGYNVDRIPPVLGANPRARLRLSFDHVLCRHLVHQPGVPYFVQVGAFDGVSGDPLYPYVKRGLLKGCLVEPQADAFERLKANYAGVEGMAFKRAAIGPRSGSATLYSVRPGTAGPEWLPQIASFSRETLLKHARYIPGLEESIITEAVPMVTFEELMADLSAPPDIVVIDTEGYDFEVIKHLRAAGLKPRLILYEHKHLSAADQNACAGLLLAAGYEVASVGEDTVAYSPGRAG